ncbi:hypothetical protein DFH28DRAFT_928987 [Melampsora americana]|nr:hypothetical protein DFH28DRAFT_928987 [Melampsora americana]
MNLKTRSLINKGHEVVRHTRADDKLDKSSLSVKTNEPWLSSSLVYSERGFEVEIDEEVLYHLPGEQHSKLKSKIVRGSCPGYLVAILVPIYTLLMRQFGARSHQRQ